MEKIGAFPTFKFVPVPLDGAKNNMSYIIHYMHALTCIIIHTLNLFIVHMINQVINIGSKQVWG